MIMDLTKYGKVLYKHNNFSKEKILEYSENNFRKVLKYAYLHSPFYEKFYSSIGIEYGDLDNINIKALPIITKKDIKENFYDIPTTKLSMPRINKALSSENLLPKVNNKYIVHTSGTTGAPTNFIYDRRALMTLEANFIRLILQGGEKNLNFHDFPIKSIYIAPVGSGYACTALAIFGMDEYKCKSIIINSQKPIDEWISLIGDYNPCYLSGYPSCLNIIASLQENGKLKLTPKKIITSGESLTKEDSQYYKKIFGADTIDYYGCTESIFIGAGTSYYDGLYLYDDLNYTEIDELNRLIITPLYNRAFPLIRYRLNDIMDGFSKYKHTPLPYTHINKILGREEDLMWFIDSNSNKDFLHPLLLDDLNIKGITSYQFVQKDFNSFEVNCISCNKENLSYQESQIKKQISLFLANKNLNNIKFSIKFVDKLEVDKETGKAKIIINETN